MRPQIMSSQINLGDAKTGHCTTNKTRISSYRNFSTKHTSLTLTPSPSKPRAMPPSAQLPTGDILHLLDDSPWWRPLIGLHILDVARRVVALPDIDPFPSPWPGRPNGDELLALAGARASDGGVGPLGRRTRKGVAVAVVVGEASS